MIKEKFFVVQGDVVDSRKIKDRDDFQRKLESACGSVNINFKEDVYASFKILKGIDEIEGVLNNLSGIYNIITDIQRSISPYNMRFSVVYGDINTAVRSRSVEKMDGPAIHNSTDRLMKLKKSHLLFDIYTGNEIVDSILRGQINLLLFYKDRWTKREKQISETYSELKKQVFVADELSISQQAVSNALRKIKWKEINLIEADLNNALKFCNNYIQHKGTLNKEDFE